MVKPDTQNKRYRRKRLGHRKSYISTVNHYLKGTYKGLRKAGKIYSGYLKLKKQIPWLPLMDMTTNKGASPHTVAPSGKTMLMTKSPEGIKYNFMGAPTVNIVNRARSVLPPRLRTKMIYAQTFDIATSPPGSFIYLWNINSLFQPSASAGSSPHQPMGFDQLSSFYRSHIVTGCKIVIEGANTSGPTAQLSLGAYDFNVTPPTTASGLNESPFFITNAVNSQHRWKIEKYFDNAAVAGLSRDAYMDEQQMWGSSTANPTFMLRGHLELNSLDLSQFVGECTATLIFYSIFFNPVQLSQS